MTIILSFIAGGLAYYLIDTILEECPNCIRNREKAVAAALSILLTYLLIF